MWHWEPKTSLLARKCEEYNSSCSVQACNEIDYTHSKGLNIIQSGHIMVQEVSCRRTGFNPRQAHVRF